MDPDDFDLDDIFGSGDEDQPEQLEPPTLRITIRGRRLTVEPWAPYLWTEGPIGDLIRQRAAGGVSVADDWITGEDAKELIIRYLAAPDRARADRRIIGWAESVGYRRVWFPDRLVHVDQGKPLGFRDRRVPHLRREVAGRQPELLGERPLLRPLPDRLRDLPRRPAPVALAAMSAP